VNRPHLFRDDKPVTGAGLSELRQRLGISVADMLWLFGMSMNKWATYTTKNANEAVSDETVEIFARLLDRHPELSPIPPMPSMAHMRQLIAEIQGEPISLKHLAVLFGRQESTGHRWITQQGRTPPILPHFARLLLNGFERHPERRAKLLKEWEEVVRLVGRGRKVEDVFEAGRWKS